MNTPLNRFAAAASVAAVLAFTMTPRATAAPLRICTFAGSPTAALDRVIAQETFKTAGLAAALVQLGGAGDDDGVSLKELRTTLGRDCDVIAGFPRSQAADASDVTMLFSRGYLRTSYVSVAAASRTEAEPLAAPQANPQTSVAPEVVAATYGSPSQLIAVQEPHVRFVLETTPEQTVAAVAEGRAQRAVVWYPAVVAYQRAHGSGHFDLRKTRSPYSDWQLVFAFRPGAKRLQHRVDEALGVMAADGRLASLTRPWNPPADIQAARVEAAPFAYRDGDSSFGPRVAAWRHARDAIRPQGGFIKVADAVGSSVAAAPSFDHAQALHGKRLYASHCAKCHGADMQGITAPALSGAAFAPASNAHLTIGGVYAYMATNMPADRPGKLKDQEYADLMAFLLNANGYAPSGAKMTADSVKASTAPLNAGPQSAMHANTAAVSAK
jgi:polar amino acid transport system substrate-binding protein